VEDDRYEGIVERLAAIEEELRDLAYDRLRDRARDPDSDAGQAANKDEKRLEQAAARRRQGDRRAHAPFVYRLIFTSWPWLPGPKGPSSPVAMPQLDTYTAPWKYATPVGKCSDPAPSVSRPSRAAAARNDDDVTVGRRAVRVEAGRPLGHEQLAARTERERGDRGQARRVDGQLARVNVQAVDARRTGPALEVERSDEEVPHLVPMRARSGRAGRSSTAPPRVRSFRSGCSRCRCRPRRRRRTCDRALPTRRGRCRDPDRRDRWRTRSCRDRRPRWPDRRPRAGAPGRAAPPISGGSVVGSMHAPVTTPYNLEPLNARESTPTVSPSGELTESKPVCTREASPCLTRVTEPVKPRHTPSVPGGQMSPPVPASATYRAPPCTAIWRGLFRLSATMLTVPGSPPLLPEPLPWSDFAPAGAANPPIAATTSAIVAKMCRLGMIPPSRP